MSITIRRTISGTLSATESLAAELTSEESLTAELSDTAGLAGEITIPSISGGTAYTGEYVITPLAYESQVLSTANKICTDDITVLEVPYYQTSNTNGDTVYIASEV